MSQPTTPRSRAAPARPADPADRMGPSGDGNDAAEVDSSAGGLAAGLSDRALLAITALFSLPIFWLGYGTDLDVEDVLLAGERIRSGDYAPSRNPGVPVVETIVGLLDPVGGHLLINLATVGALAALVVGIARIVRAWGHANGDLVALAFLASPIAVIAGTSTGDFVWALAFFVWGALAHLRDRSVVAGVVFALAIGSRGTTVLLIAAFLVADGWYRSHRRRCATTAAVAAPLGVALPDLVRSLRRWSADPLVRFAVLGLIVTEVLFFEVPWKLAHLLPSLMAAVLWVAASDRNRRPFLWLLVGAVALNGVLALRPLPIDNPDESESGTFNPAITLGLLLNDIGCRIEFMDEPPRLESGAWSCTLEPMRGPGEVDPVGPED